MARDGKKPRNAVETVLKKQRQALRARTDLTKERWYAAALERFALTNSKDPEKDDQQSQLRGWT